MCPLMTLFNESSMNLFKDCLFDDCLVDDFLSDDTPLWWLSSLMKFLFDDFSLWWVSSLMALLFDDTPLWWLSSLMTLLFDDSLDAFDLWWLCICNFTFCYFLIIVINKYLWSLNHSTRMTKHLYCKPSQKRYFMHSAIHSTYILTGHKM